MRKVYCLCLMFLASVLVCVAVLFVSVSNVGSVADSLVGYSGSVGNSSLVDGGLVDDLAGQLVASSSGSDVDGGLGVSGGLGQNGSGSLGVGSQVRVEGGKNGSGGVSGVSSMDGLSSADDGLSQNSQKSVDVGHLVERGQYWDPWTERWVKIFEWVHD